MGSTHTQINLWASIYGRPDFIERIACFAVFLANIPKEQKDTNDLAVFLRFWDLYVQKLCLNMLLKMTPGVVHTS